MLRDGDEVFWEKGEPFVMEGVVDFSGRRSRQRRCEGPAAVAREQVVAGRIIYRRMSPRNEAKYGKKWFGAPDPCGGERFTEPPAVGPAVRAATRATAQDASSERPHQYTMLVAPSPRSPDPAVAGIATHMRRHGVSRMAVEIWADDAPAISRLRIHYKRRRAFQQIDYASEVTLEFWDFGVPADIEPPPAADVMADPAPRPACRGFPYPPFDPDG